MGRRTNTFTKAIKQLKSTEVDDKIAVLEAAPTNSTMGYMSTGVHGLPKPDTVTNAFPTLPTPDFDQDDVSENGQDTTGLFNPSGVHADGTKILVEEPPGDTSYILGPMAAMYYTWSYPWTMLGYIRESDRKVVNLARIDGKLSDWDGVSGFRNDWWGGQLTLEQAVWFRDIKKYNNSGNDPANANYRAFYPGPPSNTPDAFGRYYCITTGQYKNRDVNVPNPGRTGPDPNPPSPDEVLAAIMDRIRKRAKLSNKEKEWLWDNDLGYLLPPDQRTDPRDDPANAEALDSFNKWAGGESRAEKLMNGLISALGKITKMESAANLLNMYDDFLKNPPADGQRLDATSQFSARDLNKLQSVRNQKDINFAINKAIEIANDPSRANKPINATGVSNATTLGDLQWEVAGDQVTAYLQKMAHSTGGLDNSLHNNVQIDREAFRNSGGKDIVIIKNYQFRPGGSVAGAEDTALGKTLQKGGVELDSVGSGNPLVMIGAVVAAKTGITGANKHGGLYTSPSMPYKVVVPTNSTKRSPNSRDVMNFKTLGMGYEPEGKVLSESRKSVLKNIKKPVVIPEEQKKFKVKPKLRTPNKLIGSTPKISKPVETPKQYKQVGGRNLWGKAEYDYNTTQSQERMNQVYELVGDGHMAFDHMLTDSKKMNDEQLEKFWGKNPDFYSYFYGGKKYKLVRKEQMDGDFLVFLVDDHGEKSNILQSELNEKLAEEQEMKELKEYNKMNSKKEPISFEKDYMFKRAYQKLKPQVDYKGKPAKKGYPDEKPPEMVNNRHPDFGKAPGYYNKLDPHSAAAMPQQDNPEIDAKAKDAKENPKKDSAMFRRKLDDKMKKERERLNKEEWETSDWRKELEIT